MHLFVTLFTAAVWLYLLVRFVWPVSNRWRVRGVLASILLLVGEYRLISHGFWHADPAQILPRGVLIVLAWAFAGFLLLALVILLRDLIGVMVWLLRRKAGQRILGGRQWLPLLGLLVAALSAWGTWQAVKVPAVKRVDVHLRGLPAAFDGYRIVQLSDLHATRLLPAAWQAAVVGRSNALQPDLIVITGDLEDGMPARRKADLAPLAGLHAPDGVLVVPGNHEYYSDYRGWISVFEQLGLTVLANRNVRIRRHGEQLAVLGLTDRAALRFHLPGPDLAAARKGLPADMPSIVLSHRPDQARRVARSGALLQLSGHTHGGQIPGIDLLVRAANHGFLSGLYTVGGMQLYVSNGTGLWAGFAVRLGHRSEITLLTLHPAP